MPEHFANMLGQLQELLLTLAQRLSVRFRPVISAPMPKPVPSESLTSAHEISSVLSSGTRALKSAQSRVAARMKSITSRLRVRIAFGENILPSVGRQRFSA